MKTIEQQRESRIQGNSDANTWKITTAILSLACAILVFFLWQEHRELTIGSHEKSADFDRSFIDMMIPLHQQAIDEAKRALAQAQHEELKELAKRIVSTQQQEIDQMTYWRKLWFGAHE